MKILFFDTFSGISGDMILGSFLSAGIPLDHLKNEVSKIGMSNFELEAKEIKRNSISAVKFDVIIKHKEHEHRHLSNIQNIIETSQLTDFVKEKALKVFENIAIAESRVHNIPVEKIHFHEVGAIDSIVDIIGACICIEYFGAEKIYTTPMRVGSGGFVKTQHGQIPIPAPATSEILKNYPTVITDLPYELTTPTGAAIITTLSNGLMQDNEFRIHKIGYGAGGIEIPNVPNLLRVFIGETFSDYAKDDMLLIETNIDDMNPQYYPLVIEKLIENGAIDAFIIPIIMKKGRPGFLLSVLLNRDRYDNILDTMFNFTTTIGVRIQEIRREKLNREIKEFDTSFGKVNAKIISLKESKRIVPEYEDCKRISEKNNIPIFDIQRKLQEELNK